MILIIHGNDIETSRNYYFSEKNKLVGDPVFINGDGITFDQVFQALENKTFFEESPALLIENFFAKNKTNSNEFKKITEYLADSKKSLNVIIWEDDEISKTALNSLKSAKVLLFSYPKTLFAFLDNLRPNNSQNLIKLFHELLKTMAPELVFFMLTRQMRILLNQSEDSSKQIDEVKRMAPWQMLKLRSQTGYFEKNQLINTYNKLFEIEINQKTGKVPYSMEKSIDFFLLGL